MPITNPKIRALIHIARHERTVFILAASLAWGLGYMVADYDRTVGRAHDYQPMPSQAELAIVVLARTEEHMARR